MVAGFSAKKWRQSIKCEGDALGERLSGHEMLQDNQTQGLRNRQQGVEHSCNMQQETELPQELRNASPGAQQHGLTYSSQPQSQLENGATHNIQQGVGCSGNTQQDNTPQSHSPMQFLLGQGLQETQVRDMSGNCNNHR